MQVDRSTMGLYYSGNAVDWWPAGVLDYHLDFASHFTYPHMAVVGDDLLVVMRATAPVTNVTATSKWCDFVKGAGRIVQLKLLFTKLERQQYLLFTIKDGSRISCTKLIRTASADCNSRPGAGTTTTTATRCPSTACATSGATPTCSGRRTRGSTRCGRA